jgi:hypothetical protein
LYLKEGFSFREEEIQRVEQQLYQQYVTAPNDLEQTIETIAQLVAGKLVYGVNPVVDFTFLGDPFLVRSKRSITNGTHTINMVISNEETRKIGGSHYVPFTVTAEVDNSLTLLENYKAIIETFLKHVSNTERPSILDDTED